MCTLCAWYLGGFSLIILCPNVLEEAPKLSGELDVTFRANWFGGYISIFLEVSALVVGCLLF